LGWGLGLLLWGGGLGGCCNLVAGCCWGVAWWAPGVDLLGWAWAVAAGCGCWWLGGLGCLLAGCLLGGLGASGVWLLWLGRRVL